MDDGCMKTRYIWSRIDKKSDYSGVLPRWTSDDVIGSPYAITEYTCNP